MLTSLKNICSNGLAVKPFPVCYGPHISRFLHTGTQRAVYVRQDAIFTSLWGTDVGWGENTGSGSFSVAWVTENMNIHTRTHSGNVLMWTQMHTIHINVDTLTFTAEHFQSSWNINRLPSKVFTEDEAFNASQNLFYETPFHYWSCLGKDTTPVIISVWIAKEVSPCFNILSMVCFFELKGIYSAWINNNILFSLQLHKYTVKCL